jgi:Uncharacterised protein family (UPF0137)/Protein of unknown function (DUF3102)
MIYKTSLRYINQDMEKNTQFKYETLPPAKRASIQKLTTEIKEDLQKTVHTIWDIGKKLIEVRSQIETSYFTSWLKTEFNWSRRTAYNFINVYEAFPEFSHAIFARIDNISLSALYLLAAPSTDPQIRSDFLDLALAGNNIRHKSVKAAIDEFKKTQTDPAQLAKSRILTMDGYKDYVPIESQSSTLADPILNLSETKAIVKISDLEDIELDIATEESAVSDLRPAWNSIEPGFSLFWGNTTSPRFINCLPEDAFVLAVPSCKWHHDWLLSQSRSCINLTRSKLDKELVTKLLSVLSLGEKAIVFPWLPNWKIVKLALKLNLKVYAGDPDLNKCEETIAKLGFKLTHH